MWEDTADFVVIGPVDEKHNVSTCTSTLTQKFCFYFTFLVMFSISASCKAGWTTWTVQQGLFTAGYQFKRYFWKEYWVSNLCSTSGLVCNATTICPNMHRCSFEILCDRFEPYQQRIHFNKHASASDLLWPPRASQIDVQHTQNGTSFPLTVRSGGTRSTFTFDLYKYKPRVEAAARKVIKWMYNNTK